MSNEPQKDWPEFTDRKAWSTLLDKRPELSQELALEWWNEVSWISNGDNAAHLFWFDIRIDHAKLKEITTIVGDWCRSLAPPIDPAPMFSATMQLRRLHAKEEATLTDSESWARSTDAVFGLFWRMRDALTTEQAGKAAELNLPARISKRPEISKETLAIALMFSMDNPRKKDIAEIIGVSPSSLYNYRKFIEAWNKRDALRSVTGGVMRYSPGQRGGSQALDGDDDD